MVEVSALRPSKSQKKDHPTCIAPCQGPRNKLPLISVPLPAALRCLPRPLGSPRCQFVSGMEALGSGQRKQLRWIHRQQQQSVPEVRSGNYGQEIGNHTDPKDGESRLLVLDVCRGEGEVVRTGLHADGQAAVLGCLSGGEGGSSVMMREGYNAMVPSRWPGFKIHSLTLMIGRQPASERWAMWTMKPGAAGLMTWGAKALRSRSRS